MPRSKESLEEGWHGQPAIMLPIRTFGPCGHLLFSLLNLHLLVSKWIERIVSYPVPASCNKLVYKYKMYLLCTNGMPKQTFAPSLNGTGRHLALNISYISQRNNWISFNFFYGQNWFSSREHSVQQGKAIGICLYCSRLLVITVRDVVVCCLNYSLIVTAAWSNESKLLLVTVQWVTLKIESLVGLKSPARTLRLIIGWRLEWLA